MLQAQNWKHWLRVCPFFSTHISAPAPGTHKACLKHLAHFSKPSKALLLFKAHLPCLRMKPLLTASALFTPDISSLSRASCLQYTFLNWLYSIRHFDHLKHYLLLKTSSDLPPPGISGPLCILRSQQRFFFLLLCVLTALSTLHCNHPVTPEGKDNAFLLMSLHHLAEYPAQNCGSMNVEWVSSPSPDSSGHKMGKGKRVAR